MPDKDKLRKKIYKEATKEPTVKVKEVQVKDQKVTGPNEGEGSLTQFQRLSASETPQVVVRRPISAPQLPSAPKFTSFFPRGKVIAFMKFRKVAYLLSSALFVFSLITMSLGRVPLGIDFKGGVHATVKNVGGQEVKIDDLRARFPGGSIQDFGGGSFLLRLPLSFVEEAKSLGKDAASLLSENLKTLGEFEILKVEYVGVIVGKELRKSGIYAFVLSFIGIFLYIVFRFEWKFALGTILGVVHDVIITIGLMSLFDVELSLVTLGGLLALAGYSVNDSIIIADRIREKVQMMRGIFNEDVVNKAISETLARTILTVLTVLLPVFCIIFFGGEVLRDLGTVFFIGLIIGTYSSIFIVAALAYDISRRMKKKE